MNACPDMHEAPPELEDALARIDQAKENYISLAREMDEFLYNYVKGMVKGLDRKTGNFVLQLRRPKESNVRGKPRVLVTQIVENLRTALDYMIFELSVLNERELNERLPQFVVADSESDFERQAKRRLRYLTDEQKSFVEQIQPYRGNGMLALLRCFRHQVLLRGCGQWFRCGRDRVARPSEQENLDPQPQRNRRRQEDVSKGEPSRRQTGLHSWSSDLTSELQSSVRSDEVVIATEQLQVLIEPLRRASVGKRSSRKVCRALPDGQI